MNVVVDMVKKMNIFSLCYYLRRWIYLDCVIMEVKFEKVYPSMCLIGS